MFIFFPFLTFLCIRSFTQRSREYVPFTLERYADISIKFISFLKYITSLTSPFLLYCFYRNYISPSLSSSSSPTSTYGHLPLTTSILNCSLIRFAAIITMIYSVSIVGRGILRSKNPTYREFINTLKQATSITSDVSLKKKDDDHSKRIADARSRLRRTYDYDFDKWQIDFRWSDGKYALDRVPKLLPLQESTGEQPVMDGPMIRAVSWVMAHSIGRILLYPGSIGLLQKVLNNALVTGRQFLIENYNAARYKLEARDGNHIDCIFADNRDLEQPLAKGCLFICRFSIVLFIIFL